MVPSGSPKLEATAWPPPPTPEHAGCLMAKPNLTTHI